MQEILIIKTFLREQFNHPLLYHLDILPFTEQKSIAINNFFLNTWLH
jgi:hypothetical protein